MVDTYVWDNSDINPCPFCGKKEHELWEDQEIYIRCQYCGARGPDADEVEHAVKEWNTRKGE